MENTERLPAGTGNPKTTLNRGNGVLKKLIKQRYLFMLLAPAVIFLFIFHYMPIYGVIIAFKNFNPRLGIMGSPWAGMKYFQKLVDSIFFWRVLKNTLIINLYHLVFGFPAPIILALLLNEMRKKWLKRLVQTLTYLPHFLSWVIIGGFMLNLLSPNTGIIAAIGNIFGYRVNNAVLADPKYFRTLLVVSSIWKEIGWGSIIYLAAITGIDPEYYDAAMVDGANRWKQTIHITIPCIMPTIMALLILRFGHMLGSNFEQVFVLYSPTTYSVGDVIATYVYREGLEKANYSFTTAVGLFNSLIGFILIVTANKVSKKFGGSLW